MNKIHTCDKTSLYTFEKSATQFVPKLLNSLLLSAQTKRCRLIVSPVDSWHQIPFHKIYKHKITNKIMTLLVMDRLWTRVMHVNSSNSKSSICMYKCAHISDK